MVNSDRLPNTPTAATRSANAPATTCVVRGRGFLLLCLRWWALALGLWCSVWMRGTALVLVWVAVVAWLALTMRPRVTATPDGLVIRGLIRTARIPRNAIRGLTVDREHVLWYSTIDMAVLLWGKPQLRVRWVSWNQWFEPFLTVPAASLPEPRQQRVLDKLMDALGPPET